MSLRMPILFPVIVGVAALAGCRTEPVVFEPACIAFAGDRITLSGDGFRWERYTDAREINDAGKRIDPFPDFPRSGRIERDGARITLLPDDGAEAAEFFIYRDDAEQFLLPEVDYERAVANGTVPECALKSSPAAD